MQLDSRNLPEKSAPDEEPPVPAQKQELNNRNADKYVPITCGSQVRAPLRHCVPRGADDWDSILPVPQADRVHQNQQCDLRDRGIAQPHGRLDCLVKAGSTVGQNEAPLNKAGHCETYPCMDNQLPCEQKRQCNEQSHVHFNVLPERNQICLAGGSENKNE